MVSQLSARLLADSDGGSFRSGSGSGSDGERCSSGGYSADREVSTESPPGHISMHMKHKRSSSDSHERTKRRKLNEEHYAASVAKEDMKRGGLRVRPIETEKSRIALGKVDMSRVTLKPSKDLESSPFLIPGSESMSHIKYDFDAESVYKSLVDSCRRAYELLDAVDTDDSTSSFSDTESDFSQGFSKETVVLKPRVDDLIPTTTVTEQSHSAMIVDQEVPSPPAISMTMEEALTVCSFSRYVALYQSRAYSCYLIYALAHS